MSPSLSAAVGVLLLLAAVAVLIARLFWAASSQASDPDDPWAQHNELRTPSLEQPPEASDTSVDAAIAAQINGVE